jgi:hypothetical protein
MEDSPGVRIGGETRAYVPAEATIRPLRDVIICEVLDWKPSQTIAVIYQGKPLRGRIRAIGRGTYPKRYNGRKGVRTKTWDSNTFVPTECKVGDEIELGGLELRGYLFGTFRWGTMTCVICREEDVATVTSAEQEQQASTRSSVAIA